MSHQRTSSSAGLRPTGFRSFFLLGLLVLSSPLLATGLGGGHEACNPVPVDPDGSLRAASDRIGEPFFVAVDVPSVGILSLDVTVPAAARPGSAPAEVKLGFTGPGCGAADAGHAPALVERSATHLVLAVPAPGPQVFRLAAADPSLPLGDFRLRTAFSPDGRSRSPDKVGEDEEEIEIEANPLVHEGLGESRPLASRLDELCRSGEVDDHGDSFPCATFLAPGRAVAGEIGNGWGDDQDVFVVVLGGSPETELRTLEIEAAGDVDVVGGLYDRAGQRLATGVGDGGFRIVRTVRPGTYYVRVGGGEGAEGFYALRVEASAW